MRSITGIVEYVEKNTANDLRYDTYQIIVFWDGVIACKMIRSNVIVAMACG